MRKCRIVARLDVKNDHVIKGIHLEGLRKVGNPNEMAMQYYSQGADEIFFMDAVAAYYDRNNLKEILNKACENIFIPITVGGGIRTINDIQDALSAGADKVAINTKAVMDPDFIREAAEVFGSQCIVVSIDAKRQSDLKWEVFIGNGREPTGLDVVEWSRQCELLGAGEIMLTSIDKEGTKRGFDLDLNKSVSEAVSIPIISSGGAGNGEDILRLLKEVRVDAVAVASLIHYNIMEIESLKKNLIEGGIKVRV